VTPPQLFSFSRKWRRILLLKKKKKVERTPWSKEDGGYQKIRQNTSTSLFFFCVAVRLWLIRGNRFPISDFRFQLEKIFPKPE